MELPTPQSLETAHRLLKQFDCLDRQTQMTPTAPLLPEPALVRQALQVVVAASDYQIFGICAETATQGFTALETYLEALGYASEFDRQLVEGSTYIKFNLKTGRCNAEPYAGHHRGVVVCCQSAYSDGLNETYGHLPLDLFMGAPQS